MSNRSRTLLTLACSKNTTDSSITTDETYIEVDVNFDDGKVAACMGRAANKGYRLSAQVKAKDISDGVVWTRTIGGWGANVFLEAAKRFGQKKLDTLSPSVNDLQRVVQACLESANQYANDNDRLTLSSNAQKTLDAFVSA